jgi:hypothetical protein
MDMYNNALNRYLAEGDALNQQYSMMASREAQDYQRYLDSVAQTNYENEMAYNQSRDKIADSQWRESFDYQKAMDDRNQANWEKELAYQQAMDQQAQDNWNRQFASSEEQRLYENAYNEALLKYQQERDVAADDKWAQEFAAQQAQIAIDNAYRDDAFAYQKYQDQLAQANWQNSFDYQKTQDAQDQANWEATFGYQKDMDKQAQDNWQEEFDREGKQWEALYGEGGINNPKFEGNFMYDADGNLREGYTTTNTNLFDESGNFKHASISQKIESDDGKSGYVEWNVGGKTIKLQAGYNPYTQTKNPDVKNGTFGDGGYQPDNVASFYDGDTKAGKLTATEYEMPVNGVYQTIYKDGNGREWVWDDANNEYIDVTEEKEEEKPDLPLKPNKGNTSTGSNKGAGGKSTYDPFTAVNR